MASRSSATGGLANLTNVYDGGEQVIEAGSTAYWTTVHAGGGEVVYAGGVSNSAEIDGNFSKNGIMVVSYGGTANSTTVNFDGIQNVYPTGLANDTTINYGGIQNVWGTANSSTVNGGKQNVWNIANNTVVKGGGLEVVDAGGVAINTTLEANADERVFAGGAANGVTFGNTNAMLDVDNAGCVSGPISGFGYLDQIDLRNIQFGSNTTLAFSQGVLTVSDGSSVAKLALLGQYTTADFGLSSDGHGGTFINGLGEQITGPITVPLHL